jgi:hypothetical protein
MEKRGVIGFLAFLRRNCFLEGRNRGISKFGCTAEISVSKGGFET